jgi:3',5'-cyclic AMP phosphodiesterase CpdA
MLALHLSDLHLSRYGETGAWLPQENGGGPAWELLHEIHRWRVEARRPSWRKAGRLQLVDPEGVVHERRRWSGADDKAIQRLIALALERHDTSAERLIEARPTAADLAAQLRLDPLNTNLLFLQMLDQILPVSPDLIFLTGDITDNGFGYNLVTHYLAPWIRSGRFFAVPGNHDTYDIIPRVGRKLRLATKDQCYRDFAAEVGLTPEPSGAYVRYVADLAIVGLNSCKPPRTPLSASGEVSASQLTWLRALGRTPEFRQARLRLGLVHHHLLRMPFALGQRTPIEVAMRLRNAPDVMEACGEAGVNLLLNGHRHHGYMVQLPELSLVLSSPSSTLGCKFARRDYAWLIDLAAEHPFPVLRRFQGYRAGLADLGLE